MSLVSVTDTSGHLHQWPVFAWQEFAVEHRAKAPILQGLVVDELVHVAAPAKSPPAASGGCVMLSAKQPGTVEQVAQVTVDVLAYLLSWYRSLPKAD